jgi:uncharacterized membrane protein YidH (DUF202 family)
MEQQMGADNRDIDSTSTSLQSQDRFSNFEATELEAYPTLTDSETSPLPIQKGSDRKAFLKGFWQREISLLVEHKACRDHLANERTFLAWLRTSMALSMIGVFTSQFFILQSSHLPNMNLSFFVLGVPLGSVCQVAALVNILVGAYRFWRHQCAMVKGQALAGGWEIMVIGGVVALVSWKPTACEGIFADSCSDHPGVFHTSRH